MITAIFLIAFCVFAFLYIIVLTLHTFADIWLVNWYMDEISMGFIILMAASGVGAMISVIIGELL